ncbi:MAG: beta-hydroxyacyl-ACP dehydratase [Planctomycetota bacterium]|nr:MAG: beta-hydroxyacyl-ACP dehydratase [Planctomycetota bacterium]
MNSDALIDCLPQEPPFRFLDAVLRHDPPREAVATKTFPPGDPIFAGHLPGQPIVPGVIVLEAAAQLCALVLLESPPAPGTRVGGYLAGVARLRYFRRVGPGERITLRAALERKLGTAARFEVAAEVDGERVLRGQITVGGISGA